MKDGTNGIPIIEFAGFKAKIYARIKNDNKGDKTEKWINEDVVKRWIIKNIYRYTF